MPTTLNIPGVEFTFSLRLGRLEYHFIQLQIANQKKDENVQEFFDRCRSVAMKTVPKVEDPLHQKFHYDQTQRMLLSTFIAGLGGNPWQQLRFQMPATVDQAIQIAIRVSEAQAQEKRNLAFFSNYETQRKGGGNSGQPWKTFGRLEYGQAARVNRHATRRPEAASAICPPD